MMATSLPPLALSVRQQWAWAIIHAGKDIENRRWHAKYVRRQRVALHASRGMTQVEYDEAREFIAGIGCVCPPREQLLLGGIIGTMEIIELVDRHTSPWFCGPKGLVLRDPRPCAFVPARGALGFFRWADSRG